MYNDKSNDNERDRILYGTLVLKSLENKKDYDRIYSIALDESEHPRTREHAVKILLLKGDNTESEWNNLFRLNYVLLQDKNGEFPMKRNIRLISDLAYKLRHYQESKDKLREKQTEWLIEQINKGRFDEYPGQAIIVYNSKYTGNYLYFFANPAHAILIAYKYLGNYNPDFIEQTLPSSLYAQGVMMHH